MLSIEEEIRKAQEERTKLKSVAISSKLDESRYDTSIHLGGEEDQSEPKKSKQKLTKGDGIGKMDETRARVRSALNSYTAPKDILENLPIESESGSSRRKGVEEEEDVFQEYKPKTIAEREDEYRARWRKRQLSPPRGVDLPNARSYRDIMIEQQLEREKDELVRKIQKQKREEETKARKSGKSGWDEGDTRERERERDRDRDRDRESAREKWVLSVFKSNERIQDPILLDVKKTISFGRDDSCDVPIAHASCSKKHATVQFRITGGALCPFITDLGSTNFTFLNSLKLEPKKAYAINAGDIIKFGGSTREYVFLME